MKSGTADRIDEEQLGEVLADFRSFCSLLDIRTKSGGVVSFDHERWHPEQRRFEAERTGRDIVVKPRQVGFSTLELARDLHHAVMCEGEQVLVVAHDRDLAEQLFFGLKLMYESLRRTGLAPRTRYDNVRELVFADLGSAVRVVEAGATERSARKKGRSGTVHRLHCTEVAFWEAGHETMAAVINSAAPDAEVVIESTPYGVGGLFYDDVQAAREGRNGYRLHFFPWYEHAKYRRPVPPGFDPEPRDRWEERLRARGCDDQQIAWWRSKVDDPKGGGIDKVLSDFPIDLDTCFRSSGRIYIVADAIDAIADRVRPARDQLRIESEDGRHLGDALIFEHPLPGKAYIIGGDVAEGTGNDACAAVVLEQDSAQTVATYRSDTVDEGDFGLVLAKLGQLYNQALVAPERNNGGRATLRALQAEASYGNVYWHEDKKPGWPTNTATRPVLFDALAHGIKEGSMWTPDAAVLAEARTIVRDKDGKPRARGKGQEGGCHDDRFVAWAIALQVIERGGAWVGRPFHIPWL